MMPTDKELAEAAAETFGELYPVKCPECGEQRDYARPDGCRHPHCPKIWPED